MWVWHATLDKKRNPYRRHLMLKRPSTCAFQIYIYGTDRFVGRGSKGSVRSVWEETIWEVERKRALIVVEGKGCQFVFYVLFDGQPVEWFQQWSSHLIYSLTTRVIGAPQMILQPVSSIFNCSPLPSGTWRTPGLFIPWCLPTSSSICLVFFPLSLCLARWFWPDLMNGRHVHTTAVCVSLRRSGGLRVVRLPAGSWHGLSRW